MQGSQLFWSQLKRQYFKWVLIYKLNIVIYRHILFLTFLCIHTKALFFSKLLHLHVRDNCKKQRQVQFECNRISHDYIVCLWVVWWVVHYCDANQSGRAWWLIAQSGLLLLVTHSVVSIHRQHHFHVFLCICQSLTYTAFLLCRQSITPFITHSICGKSCSLVWFLFSTPGDSFFCFVRLF